MAYGTTPSAVSSLAALGEAGARRSEENEENPVNEFDEHQSWAQWQNHGDRAAREKLLSFHMPYAKTVAAIYYSKRTHSDVEFADYVQLAAMGLMEAFERFDPCRGIKFRTYAAKRMHGAILSGLEQCTEKNQQILLRKRLRQERIEALRQEVQSATDSPKVIAGEDTFGETTFRQLAEIGIGLALGFLLEGTGMMGGDADEEAPPEGSPHVIYFRQSQIVDLQRLTKEAVGRLSKSEQSVIEGHYLQGISFGEVARMLGITKGRVSQLHRKAIASLREDLSQRLRCDIAW